MCNESNVVMSSIEDRIRKNISDYHSNLDAIIARVNNLRLSSPIRLREIAAAKYTVDKLKNDELPMIDNLLDTMYDNQTYLNELIVDETRAVISRDK